MLGPIETPKYFARLLRFNERYLQLNVSTSPGVFFIIHPAVQHAQPSASIAKRPAWLLDYRMRNYGTVVPLILDHWISEKLLRTPIFLPIFFVHSDRKTLGLRLIQAAAGNCAGLLNAHAPAPVGNCHTTLIRVKVSVSQVAHGGLIEQIASTSSGLATTSIVARLSPKIKRQGNV